MEECVFFRLSSVCVLITGSIWLNQLCFYCLAYLIHLLWEREKPLYFEPFFNPPSALETLFVCLPQQLIQNLLNRVEWTILIHLGGSLRETAVAITHTALITLSRNRLENRKEKEINTLRAVEKYKIIYRTGNTNRFKYVDMHMLMVICVLCSAGWSLQLIDFRSVETSRGCLFCGVALKTSISISWHFLWR